MALKFPISGGIWNNPAVWNGGTVPDILDEVVGGSYDVIINQDVTQYSICNTPYRFFSDNLIDDHPGTYTGSTGIVIYSGNNGGNVAYNAFCKFNFRSFPFWQSNTNNTGWLGYYFNTSKTIKRYAWTTYSGNTGYFPRTWNFEASNDGSNWTVLDSISNYTHTSNTIYFSSLLPNTSSYTRYRINITSSLGASTPMITRFDMTELSTTDYATYSGSFYLSGGVSLNLTNLTAGYINETIKFQATTGSSTISVQQPVYGVNFRAIYCDAPSPAVLNFYGTISAGGYQNLSGYTLLKLNTGTLNLTYNNTATGRCIDTTGHISATSTIGLLGGTLNLIGEIYNNGSNNTVYVLTSNTSTLNLTGNVVSTNSGIGIRTAIATTLNITGSLYNGTSARAVYMESGGPVNLNILGNIYQQGTNIYAVESGTNLVVNIDHTGVVYGGAYPAVFNLNGTSKMSGPFIGSQTTGVFPIMVSSLRLKDQATYFKIYNSSLSESRNLYTSNYAPDYPMPSDVRFGISYASGSIVGTMKIPNANNVASGASVDNTQGTAFLTPGQVPGAVWDYLTTNILLSGSIGERMKNSLSPDSLGEQIEALLP